MSSDPLYPQAFTELSSTLARLPGVGRRGAERLALALWGLPAGELATLAGRLSRFKQELTPCGACGFFASPGQLCTLCSDPSRQQQLICVVESQSQLISIERSGSFRGLYHILGGRISPIRKIGPDDLLVEALRERAAQPQVTEIVLATSTDLDGEATAHYLAKLLRRDGLTVSRIALGIPVGSDLAQTDAASMSLALARRRRFD